MSILAHNILGCCILACNMLAYIIPDDYTDEYLRKIPDQVCGLVCKSALAKIPQSSVWTCLIRFFGAQYLRAPNEDTKLLMCKCVTSVLEIVILCNYLNSGYISRDSFSTPQQVVRWEPPAPNQHIGSVQQHQTEQMGDNTFF
jgi:hypothetical protein